MKSDNRTVGRKSIQLNISMRKLTFSRIEVWLTNSQLHFQILGYSYLLGIHILNDDNNDEINKLV